MAFLPQIPNQYAQKTLDQLESEVGGNKMPLIEPGKYTAVIVKSEMKPTKDNQGQFLELTAVITQGEYRDTEFKDRLNLVNSNETAVKIAYGTLAKIAKAVGLQQLPNQSDALHNKPLLLVIKTEKGEDYRDKVTGEMRKGADKSVIAGYEAMPPIGQPSAQGFTANVHPTQAPMPWQS